MKGRIIRLLLWDWTEEFTQQVSDSDSSLGGLCTYDMETPLVDGICFGNKLYCPKHGIRILLIIGCQFDITNGFVE